MQIRKTGKLERLEKVVPGSVIWHESTGYCIVGTVERGLTNLNDGQQRSLGTGHEVQIFPYAVLQLEP